LAEIVGEYGGIEGGGDLSPEFVFGVPYLTWMGWSEFTREKYMVDYYRQTAPFQVAQNYQYQEEPSAHKYYLMFDEFSEASEKAWESGLDFGQEKIGDAVSILVGLGALYLVTR